MFDDSLLALFMSGAVLSMKVSYSLNCLVELNLTARLLEDEQRLKRNLIESAQGRKLLLTSY